MYPHLLPNVYIYIYKHYTCTILHSVHWAWCLDIGETTPRSWLLGVLFCTPHCIVPMAGRAAGPVSSDWYHLGSLKNQKKTQGIGDFMGILPIKDRGILKISLDIWRCGIKIAKHMEIPRILDMRRWSTRILPMHWCDHAKCDGTGIGNA